MNLPMLIPRPGDKVLVTLAAEPSAAETTELVRTLRRTFPGVDFTLLTGVTGLAVRPPTTPEGS